MTDTLERAKRPPLASVREAPFRLVRDATVDGEPDDGLTLDGYGAVFNSFTVIDSWEGRFRETIAPGSMKRSFRETPPKIQYDHGRHPLIGSIPIASLKSIREDTDPELAPDGGAHVIGRIFDNWLMQPVRDAIGCDPPAINGMSFRFEVVRESWTYADGKPIRNDDDLMAELRRTWDPTVPDDDLPIRTMKELKVPEIGPVMWPAYESTSVSVRGQVIDLGRLHEPGVRKLLARAVFIADSAADVASRDVSVPPIPATEESATGGMVITDVDAQQPTDRQAGEVGEPPSRKIDAQQATASEPVGEHPSNPKNQPRQRLSKTHIAKEMARTRNVLLSISNRKV